MNFYILFSLNAVCKYALQLAISEIHLMCWYSEYNNNRAYVNNCLCHEKLIRSKRVKVYRPWEIHQTNAGACLRGKVSWILW